MGRGGTPAREISFVSLVAYGPNSDSALTMGGLQPLKPGREVPNISKGILACGVLILFCLVLNQGNAGLIE